jgi:hypothetical protein
MELSNEQIRGLQSYKSALQLLGIVIEWSIENDKNEFPEKVFNALNLYISELSDEDQTIINERLTDFVEEDAEKIYESLRESGMTPEEIAGFAAVFEEDNLAQKESDDK